jgi:hypothetical protein
VTRSSERAWQKAAETMSRRKGSMVTRAIKLGSENPANLEFYHRGHGEHRGSSAILTGFEPRPPCSLCPPWLKFFPSMNPACSCPA